METADKAAILVVDDNPLIVNVLTSLLVSQNYTVYSSSNGQDACELLNHKEVDIIICDVMMPVMDGYEFHAKVRSKTELSHIPFIFLTALGSREELSMGRESGADDYLVKPFNPEDLLSIVKGKVLRSKRLKHLSDERYEAFRKRIIHTLSHEFRTPLVAINTGAELLLDHDLSNLPEKTAKLITAIQHGGQRLEHLVSDFMLLQQLEAGVADRMFEGHAKKYSAAAIMSDLKDSDVEVEGFKFSFETMNPEAEVEVFEPQILDILKRLIGNAVKFSKERKEVEVISYQSADNVIFEVKDRGIGIDVNHIKEAVDIFGQLDREVLEQQGGGMGLAIANRYAKINHASLEFENRQGGGTSVSLVLSKAE